VEEQQQQELHSDCSDTHNGEIDQWRGPKPVVSPTVNR
jgi:hypothetical protein